VLQNRLPLFAQLPDLDGFATLPLLVDDFNTNQLSPSRRVGLHAQLVDYDVTRSDGANVGFNPDQTPGPLGLRAYLWYAGDVQYTNGQWVPRPIEFGAINLMPADPIKHPSKGAVGALIIEPKGATWTEDPDSRAMATVSPGGGPGDAQFEEFRELVLVFQNFLNLRFGSGVALPSAEPEEDGGDPIIETFLANDAVPNTADAEDPEDSGQKAFNYRTEPMWFRMGFAPDAPLTFTRDLIFTDVLTNAQVGGDPETPVFDAPAGDAVRIRIVHPGGNQRNNVFSVHGHVWQREPYANGSTEIGSNPLSMWQGSRMGVGPSEHADACMVNGAGGKFGVTGDFLFRNQASFGFDGGMWGILRVTP
jgi:hypothetical protein